VFLQIHCLLAAAVNRNKIFSGGTSKGNSENSMRRLAIFAILAATVSELANAAIPDRPAIKPGPFRNAKEIPTSPTRDVGRYCYASAGVDAGRDDASNILSALRQCNDGGTAVLDKNYLISSPLDLTFLKHIDIAITGEIHFNDNDVYYWARNSFKYEFQNQSVFWKLGGTDVHIYGDLSNGKSIIDGHGQAYWEAKLLNQTVSFHS
jgi:galacturan 1,4-alpha-galacturonidase